jgi:hypothetical protein
MVVYRRMPAWNATAPVDDMRDFPGCSFADRETTGGESGA